MLPIENFDEFTKKDIKYKNLNPFAPQWPARILICAPSGSGKTNLAFNLIMNLLHWDRLYVISKMVDVEDKYIELQDWVKSMEHEIHKQMGNIPNDDITIGHFYSSFNEMPSVDEMDSDYQNLIVIDDMILAKDHSIIEDYFIRSRKKNCSVIYITQSFYRTPKLLRDNCTDFCIFDVCSKRELQEIEKTIATRISNEDLTKLYKQCVKEPHGFLYISTRDKELHKHIRMGFDSFLDPNSISEKF